MSNPALNKTFSAAELRRMYEQPSADAQRPNAGAAATAAAGVAAANHLGASQPQARPVTGDAEPMTYQNTLSKTVFLFILVVGSAVVGWMTVATLPFLWIAGAIVGLVLGLVNAFKREPSVPLIVGYSIAQGLFLGGISAFYNAQWDGIVLQAVLGTFAVFGVTLLLFRSGKVRTSPKMTKIFMIAMVGYLVFSLLNVVLMLTGVNSDPWGMRGATIFGLPLGLVIGALAVLLAAYSLVMDFELIKNGVQGRLPEKYGWTAAFGLMVTLIWLYLEILRILAIARGD